ncbi:hypothetical protein ACF0H5_016158 [Mactra antiquata]
MPLNNSVRGNHSAVVKDDDPILQQVEIGKAVLNTVSHHEYLRCAKYVNPLVRQLSNHEDTGVVSPAIVYNRNSLIILDTDVVNVDIENDEHDLYEENLEEKLEVDVEYNGCKVDKEEDTDTDSDSTLSGYNNDNEENVNVDLTNDDRTLTNNSEPFKETLKHDNVGVEKSDKEFDDIPNIRVEIVQPSIEIGTVKSESFGTKRSLLKAFETQTKELTDSGDQTYNASETSVDKSKEKFEVTITKPKSDKSNSAASVVAKQPGMDLLGEIESELEIIRSHKYSEEQVVIDNDNDDVDDVTDEVTDLFHSQDKFKQDKNIVDSKLITIDNDVDDDYDDSKFTVEHIVSHDNVKIDENVMDTELVIIDSKDEIIDDINDTDIKLTEGGDNKNVKETEGQQSEEMESEVTYKSTSFVILSPSVDRITSPGSPFRFPEVKQNNCVYR